MLIFLPLVNMGSDDDTGDIVRYSLDAGLDASAFIKGPLQSSVLQN